MFEDLVEIIEAAWRSYDEGTPTITDIEFDNLVDNLRFLDPNHPLLGRIGLRGKVRHAQSMLSLQKVLDKDLVTKWASDLQGSCFVVTPKLDGVALSLTYSANGQLLRATTRGDGELGEDVTRHARLFAPTQTKSRFIDETEVRGEAIIPTSVSVETNRRNVVAGILGRKEVSDDAKQIMFVAYDARPWNPATTYRRLLAGLIRAGFVVPPFSCEIVESFDVPFDTDGVVYTADNLSDRERLGVTGHHPRWAVALKPRDPPQETVLEDVVWQVGRTGVISPIAIVKPVILSGVTVTRATLHNAERVADLKLSLGDRVKMTRRGSVIPHIEEVVERQEGKPVLFPRVCPGCDRLVLASSMLVCPSPRACPGVRAARLEHFFKVLKIDGVGPANAKALTDVGIEPYNFFVQTIDGVGKNVSFAVKKHTRMPLSTFLEAMGIDGVGTETARRVADIVGDINDLLGMSVPDMTALHISEKTATAIYDGLRDPWVTNMLFVVDVTSSTASAGPLAGKSFVFTGELVRWTRAVAQKLVRERGGSTPSSVTKTTTYLVVGSAPGRDKTSKAEKYGIPMLTDVEFSTMLGPVDTIPKMVTDLMET